MIFIDTKLGFRPLRRRRRIWLRSSPEAAASKHPSLPGFPAPQATYPAPPHEALPLKATPRWPDEQGIEWRSAEPWSLGPIGRIRPWLPPATTDGYQLLGNVRAELHCTPAKKM